MKTFLTSLTALTLGLFLVDQLHAQHPTLRPIQTPSAGYELRSGYLDSLAHPAPVLVHRPYHLRHGVRFADGYYFAGQHHEHWAWKSWNARYQRFHYWEPSLRCYYYYCPSRLGYYPFHN